MFLLYVSDESMIFSHFLRLIDIDATSPETETLYSPETDGLSASGFPSKKREDRSASTSKVFGFDFTKKRDWATTN